MEGSGEILSKEGFRKEGEIGARDDSRVSLHSGLTRDIPCIPRRGTGRGRGMQCWNCGSVFVVVTALRPALLITSAL